MGLFHVDMAEYQQPHSSVINKRTSTLQASLDLVWSHSRVRNLLKNEFHLLSTFFFFGHTAWLVGSVLPGQGLNPSHFTESEEP